MRYLNRLSDWLFVAARAANDGGRADVLWVPGVEQVILPYNHRPSLPHSIFVRSLLQSISGGACRIRAGGSPPMFTRQRVPMSYTRAELISDAAVHVAGVVAALIAVPVLITLAAVWFGDAPDGGRRR